MMKPKQIKSRPRSVDETPTLERVIGTTATSTSAVAFNKVTGDLAYAASGVVVIYRPLTNQQIGYLNVGWLVGCVAFSEDGTLLAVGEARAREPVVEIYTFTPSEFQRVGRVQSHKFGVQHLAFSTDSEVLVTIGDENDKSVSVWNVANWTLRNSEKMAKPVFSVAFGPNYFATCGPGFVRKHSYLDTSATVSIDLSEMAKKTFVGVGVSPGNQGLFGITSDAILCSFSDHLIDKWVDLQAAHGYSISISSGLIACGCSDGSIRCFSTDNMRFRLSIPRQSPLGKANITTKNRTPIKESSHSLYADTIGVLLLSDLGYLYSLYSDRSMMIWDIRNEQGLKVFRSFLLLSDGITDMCQIGDGCYATAANDSTVRIWLNPFNPDRNIPRVVYNKEMSQIFYTTDDFRHMKVWPPDFMPETDTIVGAVAC